MDLKSFWSLLKYIKRYFGPTSILLIASSFLLLIFAELIKDLIENSENIIKIFVFLAIALLVAGLLNGLAYFIKKKYGLSINREFLDGLLTGLFAGILGGLMYHASFDDLFGNDTLSYRVLRVSLASVLIGGFYGMVLTLFKPSPKFSWHKRISSCLALSIFTLIPLAGIAIWQGEISPGKHHFIPCIVIIFIITIFITCMAIIELLQLKDSNPDIKVGGRSLSLIFYLAFVVGLVHFLDIFLFEKDFLKIKFTRDNFPEGIVAVFLMLMWSGSGYLIATKDNFLTRKIDKIF